MSTPDSNRPLPVTKNNGFNYRELLSRLVVGGLLLGSLVLVWWSYCKVLVPRLKESREINSTVARLTAQVDDLDRQWSRHEIEQINQKFMLIQPRLFTSPSGLEGWLGDLREKFTPLGLNLKTDLVNSGAPVESQTNVLMMAATITIEFQPLSGPADNSSPYQRLLQFAQYLTTGEKSAGLTGLTVDGGGFNSINHAVLAVNFWVAGSASK